MNLSFQDKISDITKKYWDQYKKPLLLSLIPTKVGENYMQRLGKQTLKAFIESTLEEHKYKLVVHPVRKAKIGLIPFDVEFQYEDSIQKQLSKSDVMGFINVLESLRDEDLRQIQLPAHVVLKLFKVKGASKNS